MLGVFWWYIALQAIGLAAFPIAFSLLPFLKDRGYSVTKPLGLLLLGYASWILSDLHVLPNTRLVLTLLLVLLALGSGLLMTSRRRRSDFRDFITREWRTIMAIEVVFLLFFVGWLLYRAFDPAINSTEKPMDFAFFNSSLATRYAPPEDPWLRGHAISYYYFGYWMMAIVAKLTGVYSGISYNVALAAVAAMSACGVFGLVYNLVRQELAKWKIACMAALGGVVFLLVMGNLEGILEFYRARGLGSDHFWQSVGIKGIVNHAQATSWVPSDYWWWWRATRVIDTVGANGISLDYTIQEFPFFSHLLGDLHPHVMSIPFVFLFMSMCLNLYLSDSPIGFRWLFKAPVYAFMLALILGALAFINTWDIATFSVLLLALIFVKKYASHSGGKIRLFLSAAFVVWIVLVLAVILYRPFYGTFSSQASAFLPVNGPSTRLVHFLIIWAFFLVAVVPFWLIMVRKSGLTPGWVKRVLFALLIVFFPYLIWAFLHLEFGAGTASGMAHRFWNVLPLMLLLAGAIYATLSLAKTMRPSSVMFVLVLMSLGFLLLLGPELLFVSDFFGNRMNTIFKLYYQVWTLFAVVGTFGIYYLIAKISSWTGWRKALGYGWLSVVAIVALAALYYPAASVISKSGGFKGSPTLDGLAYVAKEDSSEYAAIRWIKKNLDPSAGILEASGGDGGSRPGGDYNALYGRISSSTGMATVLGWYGHEHQWRASTQIMEGRWEDVATIYKTADVDEAKRLLAKYRIEYVYVGSREKNEYGSAGLDKFQQFMDKVYPVEGDGNPTWSIVYKLR